MSDRQQLKVASEQGDAYAKALASMKNEANIIGKLQTVRDYKIG